LETTGVTSGKEVNGVEVIGNNPLVWFNLEIEGGELKVAAL
jgi:hypothetical protein